MNKTIQEIYDQYAALEKTVTLIEKDRDSLRTFFQNAAPSRIIAVGCGSSFLLSESIAATASLQTGISSFAVPGGDLMLHMEQYAPLFAGKPLLLTVSRSGATSEVLYAIRELKGRYPALKTVCIACTNGSPIAAESDLVIEIPWAFDESVCQTRSVTNLYAASMLFIAAATGDEATFTDYRALAAKGGQFMKDNEEALKKIGSGGFTSAAVLCDGQGAGVASEAALAFNEIAYTPSISKHVLDVRHGPMVLLDAKTLVIIKLDKDGFHYQTDLVADILKKGAQVVVVSDEELPAIEGAAAQIAFGEKLCGTVSAAVLLPVAQLISYYHALVVGADPDQPDGLDAWIKL
ncbi:MAG: SIS domain-containing protein [Oscillibacter sp.]|nr:SIS domain-containing protein [Oscillibacter sp.]